MGVEQVSYWLFKYEIFVVANSGNMDNDGETKSNYRPEIDGLRAFAVVAVIVNHFNKALLPGGYLGVDIFFVISGYVITSSLANRQTASFPEFLASFYQRRIKRLIPALVIFVLLISVLICLFNPDPAAALGFGWSALFGFSNINLFRSATDYFAQSTELNPFTHTWSLGVEEQFYLLFPFLIWFSGFGQQWIRGARNLFLVVGVLFLASLISFIYLYKVDQPAAYFLMPPRFWEMAAGCLIFLAFQKRLKLEQLLEQVPPLAVVAAMFGVMLLPPAAAVPATLAIVLLSAVLIACLKQGTSAHQFFTRDQVVYVGLISYSLYLWHWGILCISRWTIGMTWWSVPLQIGLILAAAHISYQWIEKPFREKLNSQRRRTVFALAPVFLIAASLILKGLESGWHKTIYLSQESEVKPYGTTDSGNLPQKFCVGTLIKLEKDIFKRCRLNGINQNTMSLFLAGDSHAFVLFPMVEVVNRILGLNVYGLAIPIASFPRGLGSQEGTDVKLENRFKL